jgi:hypothetical protein
MGESRPRAEIRLRDACIKYLVDYKNGKRKNDSPRILAYFCWMYGQVTGTLPPSEFGLIPRPNTHNGLHGNQRGRPKVLEPEPEEPPLPTLDELKKLMGGENADSTSADGSDTGLLQE